MKFLDRQFVRVIIAGSRTGVTYDDLLEALAIFMQQDWMQGKEIAQVICGDCEGADLLGATWAERHAIPVRHLPADWTDLTAPGAVVMTRSDGTKYNAKAGPDRNQLMADVGHAALFLRRKGKSIGTDDCIRKVKKKGLPHYVHIVV